MGEAPARLVVGRIVKPHGVRGEMIVEVLSDAPDRYAPGESVDAGDPDGALRTLTVRATRNDRGRSLIMFEEITDRDAAEALRGALLSIDRKDAATLEDGMYYEWQLEGLTVVSEDGATLGTFHVYVTLASRSPVMVQTDGRIYVNFGRLSQETVFAPAAARRELAARLEQIPGISFDGKTDNHYPSFALEALQSNDSFELFTDAIESAAGMILAQREI